MRLWRNLHFLHHMQVFCTKSYEKGHPEPYVRGLDGFLMRLT